MTTASNPTSVHRADAPSVHGDASNAHLTRVSSHSSDETKAFYKTSEFIVYILATLGVLLASYMVKATDGHGDYFQADKAWLYVSILSVGYMVSRGLAKSGSRHHNDA